MPHQPRTAEADERQVAFAAQASWEWSWQPGVNLIIYIYINIFVDIDLIKIGYFTPPENQQPCVPHDPAEASQVTGSTKEENYQSKGFQF